MSLSKKIRAFWHLIKESLRGGQQDYTSGSIDRAIVLLSVPMILEMSMESLFAVIDVFFVSRLHDNDAVATIGLTESVLTLVYSLAMGLGMGVTAMVARRVGEKNIRAASVAATQALIVGLAISVAVGVVGIVFSDNILRVMGASEHLIERHGGYTKWMLTGNITVVLLFLVNGIFRGAGDASIAMRSLWLANTLNIMLDPIFIFGFGPVPAFGVEGAAIATNIGRAVGVAYQLYHLARGSGRIKLLPQLTVNWEVIGRLVRISSGGTGQFLIGSASWIFLVRIMSDFGSAALAGYTIAIRVVIFAILPAWGMANAAATLVGQNLGAGHLERAEKSVWRSAFLNMVFLGLVTVAFFTMAGAILAFFTQDADVLQNGIQCLQVVSLGYIFYAYGMVINQSFNGAGDTRTPMLISFFGFWLFQIPMAYALAKWLGVGTVGVYAAIATAESLMAIAGIIIFRQGKWKLAKV
jgi:putative MATE family efflux protein